VTVEQRAERSTRARVTEHAGIAVALGVLAVSWAMAAVGGAAGIPRTDDWAFGRVAFDWARSGHLRLVGWGQMSLIGLVAWAQPWIRVLGAHQWVLDVAGGVLMAVGLVAAHNLARTVLDEAGATIAVLCVVACPGFIRDATTFMTDGPALALSTVCLLAGVRATGADGRRRVRWLTVAIAFGFWAFTIRELAIAAPAAVLASDFFARRGNRRQVLAGGAALVGACATFFVWQHGLPGRQPYWGVPPLFVVIELVVNSGLSLALGIAPALAITAPRWWRPRAPKARLVGMGVGGVIALVPIGYAQWSWGGGYRWLLGDYLDPRGVNADKVLAGSRPIVLPDAVWWLITALAIAAAVVACGLIAEHVALRGAGRAATGSPTTRVLVAHLLFGAGVLTVAAARNAVVFDRYLWPFVLSGAILVLHRKGDPQAAPARPRLVRTGRGFVVALVAVVAVVLTANSDAFDGARWRLGNRAVASGNAPPTVDAGFEWVGAHATDAADLTRAAPAPDRYRTWWAEMFSSPTICIVESSSPLRDPRLTLVGTSRWRPLLVFGSATMYTYATAEPSCGNVPGG
jgi:Dolichyl-phosphate-mannose-protein mannosyltransferase